MNGVSNVLIAQAYGDTFAMPSEQMSREKIRQCFGAITKLRRSHPQNIVTSELKRAEVTDDTILSLLLAQQIIDHHGRPDAGMYLEYIEKWLNSHPQKQRVIGPSTYKAIINYRNGVPLDEIGLMGETNGAAMRISPIGILFDYRKSDFLYQVYEASRATHNTAIAISSAAAVATCISYGLRGGRDFQEMIDWAKQNAVSARAYGRDLGYAKLEVRLNILLNTLSSVSSTEEKLRLIHEGFGTSYQSIDSVTAALAIVKLSEANVLKAVQMAANLGGDTDTIASMAAGICASLRGISSLPPEDILDIESVNNIDFSYYERELSALME